MRRRRALLVAIMALALPGSTASAANLPRLVSMNVCTDQLLLTLADPEQILGLSRFSRDGWQSQADISRYPVLSVENFWEMHDTEIRETKSRQDAVIGISIYGGDRVGDDREQHRQARIRAVLQSRSRGRVRC